MAFSPDLFSLLYVADKSVFMDLYPTHGKRRIVCQGEIWHQMLQGSRMATTASWVVIKRVVLRGKSATRRGFSGELGHDASPVCAKGRQPLFR